MRPVPAALALLVLTTPALAELEDSIVVTGSRIDRSEEIPGTALERQGDYLLLPVVVVNDAREKKARHDEIYQTLKKALSAAKKDGAFEIGVLENDQFVIPLNMDNYRIGLVENQSRPDTSRATIHVTIPIPAKSAEPSKLIKRLKTFVSGVSVAGRTELLPEDEVSISISKPNQYRDRIITLAAEDIRKVTAQLGDEYRVRLKGIDRQVRWVRSGVLSVTLYIPYTYEIVPKGPMSFADVTVE